MIQMTIQVPDKLAMRCQAAGPWLPTLMELSFIGFRTRAASVAAEVTRFLSENPSSKEMAGFHVSEHAQTRLRRLFALNQAGCLSENERLELDELESLEHIIVMLKARIAGRDN